MKRIDRLISVSDKIVRLLERILVCVFIVFLVGVMVGLVYFLFTVQIP